MIKVKKFKNVGIVGYGSYVPRYRLAVKEVARVWGKDGDKVEEGLGIAQKSVADRDEDSVTMAVEAGQRAIAMVPINPEKMGAVFVGSESHPYAVKPSGTIVADILGVGEEYFCADLQFACKAATAGLQIVAAMIESGMIEYGLVIGSDTAQGKPGDALEYTAGAGAAAFVLGGKKQEWIAKFISTSSFSSDTPDFWRRQGEKFPVHGGRFTGEPGYFKHIVEATKRFLAKEKMKIEGFDRVVMHMPNLKFPVRAAEILGVRGKQLEEGLIVKKIGNPYCASAILGLVAVLNKARKGERVLVTAYGSGAGSDVMILETTEKLAKKRRGKHTAVNEMDQGEEVDYSKYLQLIGEL